MFWQGAGSDAEPTNKVLLAKRKKINYSRNVQNRLLSYAAIYRIQFANAVHTCENIKETSK